MTARSDVLLWARRVAGRQDATAHVLLELPAAATLEDAQEAFHKIARLAHPDLHRTTLDPPELELVTLAYSRVAGAYQEFRTQRMQTTRIPRLRVDGPPSGSAAGAGGGSA
ncbi:MAG: hypothetical protein H0X17_05105, partial [Deltaproteobacteria bacterium]|nr:hypothetical protein [Deltaproteobacteria bacterium]